MARRTSHPVTKHLDFANHRAMAEHWGNEAVREIRAAIANPHPTTREDLNLNHAIRSTRMAWWHIGALVGERHGIKNS